MDPVEFKKLITTQLSAKGSDKNLRAAALESHRHFGRHGHFHHFEWMGVPVIQAPQDLIQMQELIFKIKPTLIVETGVARGGSMVFYASILQLLVDTKQIPETSKVVGIDIDIRKYTQEILDDHPLRSRIELISGSSTSSDTVAKVRGLATKSERVLLCLDSNHTHEHVLLELELLSSIVTVGSYCVVFDTLVEFMPEIDYEDRPWGPGNNPHTAVVEFLKNNSDAFRIDTKIDNKLIVSAAINGFLQRIK